MISTHGIHHVTAVTAKIKDNLKFYTEVLGLRLVKKSVNQDDVSAYHLFYADKKGTPGTDMTFFDWEKAGVRQIGTDQISRTYFRVNGREAIEFWDKRLAEYGLSKSEIIQIDKRDAILFEDPEGQRLGLIDDQGAGFEGEVWDSHVPAAFCIRGFYAVELSIPEVQKIEPFLTQIMQWELKGNFTEAETGDSIWKFSMAGSGPGKEIFIREVLDDVVPFSTAGSVHHVAFRVQDEQALNEWIEHLAKYSYPNSGIVERYYFTSLYFRISRGILFELATDGPGFASDEDEAHLGEKLALPPFLESQRKEIEAGLKPL
jgi:glyoxalase family protein